MQYCGAFYRSAQYGLFTRINTYLVRWIEQGIPVPDRSMTVAEYMEHWLSIVKVERRLTT